MTFSEIKRKIRNLGQYKTLKKIKRDHLRIVKNSKSGAYWLIEDEFLKPVIKSPRECKSIVVNLKDLKFKVLMVGEERKDLRKSKIFKYIRWGEERGFNQRPTCASREKWFEITQKLEKAIIFRRFFDTAYNLPLIKKEAFIDQTFYLALPHNTKDVEMLNGTLNSTLISFFIELLGRYGLGEGVLQYAVYEEAQVITIDPSVIQGKTRIKLLNTLESLQKRKGVSIFKELGAENSKDVALDKIKPDRRELDKIVMGEILGLSDDEQLEVYQAIIDLVKSRIEKAKSFGKRQKTKGGIDIDALVNIVLKKIGDDTLGKFYKEKILSREDLVTKKLPELNDKPEIKKGLFGWQLVSGKNFIDCSSETRAQYLKIWLEAGVQSIKLPKDKKYLKKATKKLKKLKINIDQIIEDYLGYILDHKLKSQILHQLWQRII